MVQRGNLSELRMRLQPFPGRGSEPRLPIHRLAKRFGAVGAPRSFEPPAVEWFLDQLECVGCNRGFLLRARRVTGADVKTGEQQPGAGHRAARVSRQPAGTRGVEQAKQVREQWQ